MSLVNSGHHANSDKKTKIANQIIKKSSSGQNINSTQNLGQSGSQ